MPTDTQTIIVIPSLAGTRYTAGQVMEAAATGDVVTLDFGGSFAVGQAFCDELAKQLLEQRVTRIVLVGASPRAHGYIRQSLRLRDSQNRTELVF